MTNNCSPSALYRETRISQKICIMTAKTHAMLRLFRLYTWTLPRCNFSGHSLHALRNVYDTLLPGRYV